MTPLVQAMSAPYPTTAAERDRWILSRQAARNPVDPWKPYSFVVEEERSDSGAIVSVATIFLTNRECPWRCLMCDLWKNTLAETVPVGAIPAQIDYALQELGRSRRREEAEVFDRSSTPPLPGSAIKLYNSGSFFDPRAIPTEDYPAIAQRVANFERVIVECHPALIGEACLRFRDRLRGKLEIAIGLETVHPEVLPRLNKRMTLEQFVRAAEFLQHNDIALRVFILVKPPFLNEAEALEWAGRSIDFAFDHGAGVVSLIPTRPGNGALEALADLGQFSPPRLSTLEQAAAYGVNLRRGQVFADLWDLEKFSDCAACIAPRRERLRQMNCTQKVLPDFSCRECANRF